MRAVFFGTPEIAVPALVALTEVAEVVGVVCQPDRPAGRGLELKAPPVKVAALGRGIPVMQPEKIRTPELAAWLAEREADVALVLAYGRILPPAVLTAPKRGCMNLHASLLPRYRGAAPITWAIVRGERETGISLMQMDEGLDTGPVYVERAMAIGPEATADDLAKDLGSLAARVVKNDLRAAVDGRLHARPQDESLATLAPILEKKDGRIDWSRPAQSVHDHVRGMTSWPGAFTAHRGKALKILSTRIANVEIAGAPGTVVRADKGGILVACATGSVMLLRAQLEGKKPLGAAELVSGRSIAVGDVLGASA